MEQPELERLARVFNQRVFRFAYARLGNRQDAEDVTQETFLRLVRFAPEFSDDTKARAWLFQVAANCANDFYRFPWRKHELSVDELPERESTQPETDGILETVLSLPPKYRSVIHLFYYENESIAEISETLSMSQSAVKTRLTRARKLLQEALKEGESYV